MPLILALGKQREGDLYEFKASLVYRASSKRARAVIQRTPVSQNQKREKEEEEQEKEEEEEDDHTVAGFYTPFSNGVVPPHSPSSTLPLPPLHLALSVLYF